MPKYDVTIFPVVAVYRKGIEAESPQDAIGKAMEHVDLEIAISEDDVQYAEEVAFFRVGKSDIDDDDTACFYQSDGETIMNCGNVEMTDYGNRPIVVVEVAGQILRIDESGGAKLEEKKIDSGT